MKKACIVCTLLICMCALITGCKSSKPVAKETAEQVYARIMSEPGGRKTETETAMPSISGNSAIKNDVSVINTSNIDSGYIAYEYTGDAEKVILQITQPDGTRYSYPIDTSTVRILPLTAGDGSYRFDVFENVKDNAYATGLSDTIDVKLKNEFSPFLLPNQYTDYTPESECVKLARNISEHSATDLKFVNNVYDYIISDITYDKDLAQNVKTNYIPDPDSTLKSKKGICFDYASLTTSMLRSQGIPTKLVVGYAGTAYHAWISVYLKETGWVDNIIRFDGKKWSFMDPTIAANDKNDKKMQKLTGDGTTYTAQYNY